MLVSVPLNFLARYQRDALRAPGRGPTAMAAATDFIGRASRRSLGAAFVSVRVDHEARHILHVEFEVAEDERDRLLPTFQDRVFELADRCQYEGPVKEKARR